MRKVVYAIVSAVVSLTLFVGCGGGGYSSNYDDESEYAEICISEQTGTRVDDTMCQTHSGLPPQPWFIYAYYPIHYWGVPPIGGIVHHTHYVRTRPANVTVKKATPRGNAAPLPYSEAEKKKRRDAIAKQQDSWYKRQQEQARKNGWSQPPKGNGGAYKPSTTGGSSSTKSSNSSASRTTTSTGRK